MKTEELESRDIYRIRDAYAQLSFTCETKHHTPFPRPHRNPTVKEYYAFFAAITPDLHHALNQREKDNLTRNIHTIVDDLKNQARPRDELLTHTCLLVIAPCFGLPQEMFRSHLKDYNNHLAYSQKSFKPNITVDKKDLDKQPHKGTTHIILDDILISPHPNLRSHIDKHQALQEIAPLCNRYSSAKRSSLQRLVTHCLDRQLAILYGRGSKAFDDVFTHHTWTVYLGAYNTLAALPPTVGLDMRRELWPGSDFLKHPLRSTWKNNYIGDSAHQPWTEPEQKT